VEHPRPVFDHIKHHIGSPKIEHRTTLPRPHCSIEPSRRCLHPFGYHHHTMAIKGGDKATSSSSPPQPLETHFPNSPRAAKVSRARPSSPTPAEAPEQDTILAYSAYLAGFPTDSQVVPKTKNVLYSFIYNFCVELNHR